MIKFARAYCIGEDNDAFDRDFLANALSSLKNEPNKVNMNAKDDREAGMTPLHYAVVTNNAAIVEALLSKEAMLNLLANNASLPIHHAVESGNLKILALLLKIGTWVELETFDNFDDTPLLCAIFQKDFNKIKLLVEAGLNIENKGTAGRSLLCLAASAGDMDVIRYLVEDEGANINTASKDGYPPISCVYENNQPGVYEYLKDKGALLVTDSEPDNYSYIGNDSEIDSDIEIEID